jgi:hypothetical protein
MTDTSTESLAGRPAPAADDTGEAESATVDE